MRKLRIYSLKAKAMLTSSSAFAAIFSRPERPPLIRGWAEFPYSTKHVVLLIGKSRFRF